MHKQEIKDAAEHSEHAALKHEKGSVVRHCISSISAYRDVTQRILIWFKLPLRQSVILTYRMESEGPPVVQMRLKVEINTREHFAVDGYQKKPFTVQSRWFQGQCEIKTYVLEELLATKVRALFQRRKGRDLYDLRKSRCRQSRKNFQTLHGNRRANRLQHTL